MSGVELTFAEKKQIKDIVCKKCANYCRAYGCLPEDAECYMMSIGYRDSRLCRYFEAAILSDSIEMQKIFCSEQKDVKVCSICGRRFYGMRNRRYCSEACSYRARKKAAANRNVKYRRKKKQLA